MPWFNPVKLFHRYASFHSKVLLISAFRFPKPRQFTSRSVAARSILPATWIVPGVISAGVSVPVQIPSQTPDLTGNYWPRLQWSQLFGFPPASLLVGQESPPPPSVTPSAVPRPLLASLGIPTQSTQHQAPSTPATTPVHNSDTSEWEDWLLVTRAPSHSDPRPRHDAVSFAARSLPTGDAVMWRERYERSSLDSTRDRCQISSKTRS